MDASEGEKDLKLYRCNYCQLVLPKHLLRLEDYVTINEKHWVCACEIKNDFSVSKCKDCNTLIPEYLFQRRFIFKR